MPGNIISSSDRDAQAAFLCNHKGDVCIAFDDPAFVRAETILVDMASQEIHAILYETEHRLGHVSPAMALIFAGRDEVLLTAIRPDGTIFEMTAPIHAIGSKH